MPAALGQVTIDSLDVWTIELRKRWGALLHEILVDGTAKRTVKELADECKTLILITAWFECHGNRTSAAELRGSSRRDIRERVTAWHEANPQILLRPEGTTSKKATKTRPPKNDEGQPSEAGLEAATPAAEEPSRDTEEGPT